MNEVENNFIGSVKVENEQYTYIVDGHIVRLTSPIKAGKTIVKDWNILFKNADAKPQFILGVNDSGYEVAFWIDPSIVNGGISIATHTWKYVFHSPVILKGTRNLNHQGIDEFDALTFSGGTINKIYNPKHAVSNNYIKDTMQAAQATKNEGKLSIKLHPFSRRTKRFDGVCLFGQKLNITISISQQPKYGDWENNELGELKTFIRLEFEHSQKTDEIGKYYNLVQDFVSFLVGQQNVIFDMQLKRRTASNEFETIALSKIYKEHENYFSSSYTHVIPLNAFKNKLSSALEVFASLSKKHPKPYLRFLPSDNRKVSSANYDNIRDLCAALEIEYSILREREKKNKGLTNKSSREMDFIKAEVSEIIEKHKGNLSERAYNSISGNLKHWNISAAEQSFELYKRYKSQVDVFLDSVNKHRSTKIIITEDSIGKFIKIRNDIAHSGNAHMDIEEINLFAFLKCLIYFSIFERIGFRPKQVAHLVSEVIFRCDRTIE